MGSQPFRSDGGPFVGLAAAIAAAGDVFAPLGGGGEQCGQTSDFRPFHDAGVDSGIMGDAADMVDGFPDGMDMLADNGGSAGLWDGESPLAEGLEELGDLDAGETLLSGDEEPDLTLPGMDEMPLPFAADVLEPVDAGAMDAPGDDERIAALAEQHDRELEAVRAEFGEDAAERIRAGLAAMEQRLIDEIGTQVAQILAPLLSAQARERSVEAFTDALRGMLADSDAVSVRVEGPPDLLERIETALGSVDARLEFRAAEKIDLRAQVADSVIMTRLGEWADELAGAIHAVS